jgi:hypothetical protein
MILMNVAYYVHGAIAPMLPYDVPREKKQAIKDLISWIEGDNTASVAVGARSECKQD